MLRYAVTAALCLAVQPAFAGHGPDPLERCLKQVQAIRPGQFVKVEYLGFTDEQRKAYEIEIRTDDKAEWEFECSVDDGSILEIEQEVPSASHELFKRNMKVDEDKARNIATQLYPGRIAQVEYEIEADGASSYEFDIVDRWGVTFKVEVDAATGRIVEVQIERWQIGYEAEE
jgi:uncharacterized membrane protein YkoI